MHTSKFNMEPKYRVVKGYLTLQVNSMRQVFEIKDFITIGRLPESDTEISLPDPFVSTRHCRIEKRRDEYCVKDLQSRNGTYLNGTRVTEAVLRDGDVLRVGETELTFSTRREDDLDNFLLSSRNASWQSQLDRIPLIARSDLPVLIGGPSGSGKEIMATSIHRLSNRARGPFVSVNCSALTESLIESELFGHIKGSFTGAGEDRKGAFLSAKSGTLFLDEIGDLPPNLQPKLLRALENQEIKPVGSDRPIPINVRIISATHKNLLQMVQKNLFREDLYFRLNVLRVNVPALHERKEDFEDLLRLFGRRFRVDFTPAAVQKLMAYGWPGQVRELKNFVARAGALFPAQTVDEQKIEALFDLRQITGGPMIASARQKLQNFEVALIKEKLIANRGNIRRTAAALGLPKSTLYDRIKAYGINVHALAAESYFGPDGGPAPS